MMIDLAFPVFIEEISMRLFVLKSGITEVESSWFMRKKQNKIMILQQKVAHFELNSRFYIIKTINKHHDLRTKHLIIQNLQFYIKILEKSDFLRKQSHVLFLFVCTIVILNFMTQFSFFRKKYFYSTRFKKVI